MGYRLPAYTSTFYPSPAGGRRVDTWTDVRGRVHVRVLDHALSAITVTVFARGGVVRHVHGELFIP